jgi:hypothetical protein
MGETGTFFGCLTFEKLTVASRVDMGLAQTVF